MEERVKRLERWNRILVVIVTLGLGLTVPAKLKEFLQSGPLFIGGSGLATNRVETEELCVIEKPEKPQARMYAMDSEAFLSFIDSTHCKVLEMGISKDSKGCEVPYIAFNLKSGRQVLKPSEEGKVTWATGP